MQTSLEGGAIFLITGKPGIGKTTLVSQLATQLSNHANVLLTGFYTEEVRTSEANGLGHRVGFDAVLLTQDPTKRSLHRAPLARVQSNALSQSRSFPCVGQYSVLLQSFETLCVPCIQSVLEKCQELCPSVTGDARLQHLERQKVVCVIDEIGKMELLSHTFKQLVGELIDRVSNSPQLILVATVPSARFPDGRRGIPFVDELCSRQDVELIEVTFSNRTRLREQVYQKIISRFRMI